MDTLLLLTILIVICALVFDFINGFHDTANAIATSVSTKALKPRHAIVIRHHELSRSDDIYRCGENHYKGHCESLYIRQRVSCHSGGSTRRNRLELDHMVFRHSEQLFTCDYRSDRRSIAASGFATLNYKGFIKIIEALILSPIIAFVLGFIVYSIVKLIFKDSNLAKTNKRFRRVQILTAAIQSYTHGTNDAQKRWVSLRWRL